MNAYQHILLATDFSKFSEEAARRAVEPVLNLAFIDPVWVRANLPEPALGQVAL